MTFFTSLPWIRYTHYDFGKGDNPQRTIDLSVIKLKLTAYYIEILQVQQVLYALVFCMH